MKQEMKQNNSNLSIIIDGALIISLMIVGIMFATESIMKGNWSFVFLWLLAYLISFTSRKLKKKKFINGKEITFFILSTIVASLFATIFEKFNLIQKYYPKNFESAQIPIDKILPNLTIIIAYVAILTFATKMAKNYSLYWTLLAISIAPLIGFKEEIIIILENFPFITALIFGAPVYYIFALLLGFVESEYINRTEKF
ncbi:MAG: hypothetical protein ACOZAO_02260 [Patescibacteria group bacterium]